MDFFDQEPMELEQAAEGAGADEGVERSQQVFGNVAVDSLTPGSKPKPSQEASPPKEEL